MKKLMVSVALLALLAGCTSPEYQANSRTNQSVSDTINKHTTYHPHKKVTYIKKPPTAVVPIKEEYDLRWLKEPVSVNVANQPLSVVLEEVLYQANVPIYFGEGVEPNKLVTLNFSSQRENLLNLLSRETGYGIEVKKGRLEVTRTITRLFTLNIPTGMVTGQLGSQGESSGDEGSVRIEGQYLNVAFNEMDVTKEVAKTIQDVLGGKKAKDSIVTVSPTSSSFIVKTTPDKMQDVQRIFEQYQSELSKQVLLDIQVLEFRSNLGTERGVDWKVVRDTGSGLLKFFVPGTSTVSEGGGYGFAFQGSGKLDGTQTFIKVLKKQGSVAVQTPVLAMALNNQPAKITQQREVPYIDETSSNSEEGVISSSATRGEKAEGIDMMVVAKVQPEFVWLRISGQLRKIVEKNTEKIGEVQVGMLTSQKSEITFVNKLRYGQTFVIASIKQNSSTIEKNENFFTKLFGGTGSRNETVETLVLLTPRKVE